MRVYVYTLKLCGNAAEESLMKTTKALFGIIAPDIFDKIRVFPPTVGVVFPSGKERYLPFGDRHTYMWGLPHVPVQGGGTVTLQGGGNVTVQGACTVSVQGGGNVTVQRIKLFLNSLTI